MSTNSPLFTGKVAFITRAGIGRATALAFAREDASVVVMGRTEATLPETVRLIEQADGRALAVPCDVTRSEDIRHRPRPRGGWWPNRVATAVPQDVVIATA